MSSKSRRIFKEGDIVVANAEGDATYGVTTKSAGEMTVLSDEFDGTITLKVKGDGDNYNVTAKMFDFIREKGEEEKEITKEEQEDASALNNWLS